MFQQAMVSLASVAEGRDPLLPEQLQIVAAAPALGDVADHVIQPIQREPADDFLKPMARLGVGKPAYSMPQLVQFMLLSLGGKCELGASVCTNCQAPASKDFFCSGVSIFEVLKLSDLFCELLGLSAADDRWECPGAATFSRARQRLDALLMMTQDAVARYMHDVRQNPCIQQLQLEDHDHTYEPEDMEPPMLEVQCRALPVASIGKGAAAFANKLDAVIFTILLEDMRASMFRCGVCIGETVMKGVEHDIATAPAIDVAALHRENAANLCSNSTLVPVGGLGHDDDDAPNFLTEDLVDLQQAEEMRLARVHEQEEQARWPSTLTGLRAVERLLRPPTMRDRFRACCVRNEEDAKPLATWSHTLASLRWEVLVDFTRDLLLLEPVIRRCWNKELFMQGLNTAGYRQWRCDTSSDHGAPTVQAIDEAICSPEFWSGVAIVHDLAYEAEFVGRWAEGCSCCRSGTGIGGADPDRMAIADDGERQRKPRRQRQPGRVACPYAGCRAPELASGDWIPELKRVMNFGRGRLTEFLVMSRAEDRSQFHADWVQARSKLWAGIQVKLAYFQQLPWRAEEESEVVIFGLGWEVSTMVRPGESILQIYDSDPESKDVGALLHWLAAMRHASALRQLETQPIMAGAVRLAGFRKLVLSRQLLHLKPSDYTAKMNASQLSALLYRDHDILKHSGRERLQEEVDAAKMIESVAQRHRVVFSMPVPMLGQALQSWQQLLEPTAQALHDAEGAAADAIVDEPDAQLQLAVLAPEGSGSEIAPARHLFQDPFVSTGSTEGCPVPPVPVPNNTFFFRIVGGNMSRHTLNGDPLRPFDFTIQRYVAVEHADVKANEQYLAPQGAPMALSLQHLSFDDLASNLSVWTQGNRVMMAPSRVESVSTSALQLLSELLEAGATEGAKQNFFFIQDDDHERSFTELRSSGLATWIDEPAGRIAATRKAASGAGLAQLYHGPTEVCESVSSSQVGQDMEGSEGTSTVFGLLIKLLQDGWRERGFATKTGLYLECLWSAEVDAYRELLGMKPRRPRAGRGHGSAMAAIEDEGQMNLLADGNEGRGHQPAAADGDVSSETTDADEAPATRTDRGEGEDEVEEQAHDSENCSNVAL
ncbi:chk1 [Symbiodinium sp. KB8]|nr:chk1 [Symbiodinium sp. KB8]